MIFQFDQEYNVHHDSVNKVITLSLNMYSMTIEGTPGYKQISTLSAASDNAHSMIPGEILGCRNNT